MDINNDLQQELATLQQYIAQLEELRLKQEYTENKLKEVVDNIKEIIFQADTSGCYIFLNPAWTEITGFTIEETLGKSFLDYVHPDFVEDNIKRCYALMNREKDVCRHEVLYLKKDGSYVWVEVFARLTIDKNDNTIGVSGTVMDINERKMMEIELEQYKNHLEDIVKERTLELNKTNEKLIYLANHDSLTNIPNRYYLENEINKIIKNKLNSALLFIDLDNFKLINDTFGHTVGDGVLKQLVNVFKNCLRPNDLLARLGGDEFAILIKDTSIDSGKEIAEQLRKALDENEIKIPNFNTEFDITTSIGVVPIDGSLNLQELLTYADTALYAAKDNGKNRVISIQSFEDKTKLSQTNNTLNNIKSALKENRFTLYYQPVYKLQGGILHYEALIRMIDKDGSIITPNDFIPLAERFGLMSQIDRWVIKQAIQDMKTHPDMKIFVNLSGISIGDTNMLEFINNNIKINHVTPLNIGFEITETTAIREIAQSEKWIKKLKELGCKFALDDFGVGFSSFSYLNKLPIDYLKIDGSFVKELDTNHTHRDLIQAMNAVAHSLGKETIAEFVENEEIVKILKELGVDHGQGYHLGKPKPL